MGTFGRGGIRRAAGGESGGSWTRSRQSQHIHMAATQGIEVGKAKDCPRPLRDDGEKMNSGTETARRPHQAGRQPTSKPSSAA